MFKAKLIENDSYYSFKNKELWLSFFPAVVLGVMSVYYQRSIWFTLVFIGIYILGMIALKRNQKRISAVIDNNQLEMDEQEIRIKSKGGTNSETIKLSSIEKIIIKDNYSIPQETVTDVVKEMSGDSKKNYLILYQNKQERKLDFEVESYYMLKQLSKVIDKWKANNCPIEILNVK